MLEIKLAAMLERKYSKKEILEKYVNTIYFGNGCYGITAAAKNFFGVSPEDLTLNQSAALAGIVKSPAVYSPKISPEKCNSRKNVVLKEMYEQNYISESEYNENVKENVYAINDTSDRPQYLKLVENEANDFLNLNPYSHEKYKIHTFYDRKMQENIENAANAYDTETDKSIMILDSENKIRAFYSTCGDGYRQLGSTLKPLAVFAPAIETGVIDSCTPIKDEKINFGGYAPSNYNDVYYGFVSAKFALAKSLNSCAVKVLNDVGIKKALSYLKKTDIAVNEKDESLRLALGVTEKGATLTQISGAYGSFINKGVYSAPITIDKICTEEGKTVYKPMRHETRVFGEDTAFIINDMLKYTAKKGTAKSLSQISFPLAAKTGTVGNEKGNTDAYAITYNGDYVISCWLGNADSSLMNNSVSGGTIPTLICRNIWQTAAKKGYVPHDTFTSDKVTQIDIDKISYEENHTVLAADENFPERYVLTEYFKSDRVPKTVSNRFTIPKIENADISIKNKRIVIRLCLPQYCEYKIYRENDGIKFLIYDSYGKKDKTEFNDKNFFPNTKYIYSVIPYVLGKNGVKYGEEYFLPEIKTPAENGAGDEWWKDPLFV